jgi:hypothetical protein
MKIVLYFLMFFIPGGLMAQPQQSANFRLTKSVLDAGGGANSSANFRLTSAIGQPSPPGVQASTNFVLTSGFLAPLFAVSALSPIQHLVILPQLPNVNLSWERVAGAARYNVYRSTDPHFTPGPTTLLGSATDTSYVDANIMSLPALKNFYSVTAIDRNGVVLVIPHSMNDVSILVTEPKR